MDCVRERIPTAAGPTVVVRGSRPPAVHVPGKPKRTKNLQPKPTHTLDSLGAHRNAVEISCRRLSVREGGLALDRWAASAFHGTAMSSFGEAKARIMVVEDNDKLLALLRRALERAEYEVVPAVSGAEMMNLLQASKPDLIVLDISLPDTDGRDLLVTLKKDPRTFSIPVIVWSGRYADSDRLVALDLGAEDYVEKGAPTALVPKIQRILLRISERELVKARESFDAKE
jgi:CheY-like chemotaxis protein